MCNWKNEVIKKHKVLWLWREIAEAFDVSSWRMGPELNIRVHYGLTAHMLIQLFQLIHTDCWTNSLKSLLKSSHCASDFRIMRWMTCDYICGHDCRMCVSIIRKSFSPNEMVCQCVWVSCSSQWDHTTWPALAKYVSDSPTAGKSCSRHLDTHTRTLTHIFTITHTCAQ